MKQILLLLYKQFGFSGFQIMFAMLIGTMAIAGCAHKSTADTKEVAKITILDTPTVITTESDDVFRSYSFKDIPLQLFFSDTTWPSYIAYGHGFRKNIKTLFYTREMAEKNAPHLAAHYTIDRDNFMDEPARNTLMQAAQITIGNHKYVLCVFDKHQLNIGPLEHYYYYLVDVTDNEQLSAIAFTGLAEEGDYLPKVYAKNNKICLELTYYSHLKAGDYTTETTVVTQVDGEWVMQ